MWIMFTCDSRGEAEAPVKGSGQQSRRFRRRKRSPDILSLHTQRYGHLAQSVVLVFQQDDGICDAVGGIRNILDAAQIRVLNPRKIIGRMLCKFKPHRECPR